MSNLECKISIFVNFDEQLIVMAVISDLPELIHGKQSRTAGQREFAERPGTE